MIFDQAIINGMTAEEAGLRSGMTLEDAKRLTLQDQITKSLEKLTVPIAGILSRGISYNPTKGAFTTNDDWTNMDDKNRKLSFDTHALGILKAPEKQLSTPNKLNAINLLFESNFNPYVNEYSDATDYLKSNPKFVNFLNIL